MPLAAQDGPSSRKSSGAQYRTAEQVDRDAVLLAGRSHLQGKRDIDWDVTDAEVRDWVKCIYDHVSVGTSLVQSSRLTDDYREES